MSRACSVQRYCCPSQEGFQALVCGINPERKLILSQRNSRVCSVGPRQFSTAAPRNPGLAQAGDNQPSPGTRPQGHQAFPSPPGWLRFQLQSGAWHGSVAVKMPQKSLFSIKFQVKTALGIQKIQQNGVAVPQTALARRKLWRPLPG